MSKDLPKQASAGFFELASEAKPTLVYMLPEDHTLEDALRPEYWAGRARQLMGEAHGGRPWVGSKIELHREDGTFYALLFIRAVRTASVDVALIGKPIYFGPREHVETEKYDTRWNVGARGYDIIRKSDKQVVAHARDLPKKEDAMKWIADMAA